MRWTGHVACVGEINSCKVLVRKSQKKKPLERPRHRWEDNVKIDTMKIGCESVYWTQLVQGMDFCEHGNESSSFIKGEKYFD